MCPDPKSILDGTKCFTPPDQVCAGNPAWCDGALFYDAFQCSGGIWTTTATTICGDGGSPDAVYDAAVADAGVTD